MAQFDVRRNKGASRGGFPFFVVLQSSMFRRFDRWVVVPLTPASFVPQEDPRLNPILDIGGEPFLLATLALTNVPVEQLGEVLTNLESEADRIIGAIDWMMNRGAR